MSIYEKLLRIQKSLIVSKENNNTFGGFKYRTLSDILIKLKPLLKEENCLLYFDDDIRLVSDQFYVIATATLIDIVSGDKVSNQGLARETREKSKWDSGQLTGAASSYARKYALAGLLLIDDSKDIDSWDNGESTQAPVPAPANNQQRKKSAARVSAPAPARESAPASVSASPAVPAGDVVPAPAPAVPAGDVVPAHEGEGLSDEQVNYLLELIAQKGEKVEKILNSYRIERLHQLSKKQYVGLVKGLAEKVKAK